MWNASQCSWMTSNPCGGEAFWYMVCMCGAQRAPPLPSYRRVDWNITGTVLASSADDGIIRLRRRTLTGEWECTSVIDAVRGGLLGTATSTGDSEALRGAAAATAQITAQVAMRQ